MEPDDVEARVKRLILTFTGLCFGFCLVISALQSVAERAADAVQSRASSSPPSINLAGLIPVFEIVGLAVIAVIVLLCVKWAVKHLPYLQRLRFRVYLDKPKVKKGMPRQMGADGELMNADGELDVSTRQSMEDMLG